MEEGIYNCYTILYHIYHWLLLSYWSKSKREQKALKRKIKWVQHSTACTSSKSTKKGKVKKSVIQKCGKQSLRKKGQKRKEISKSWLVKLCFQKKSPRNILKILLMPIFWRTVLFWLKYMNWPSLIHVPVQVRFMYSSYSMLVKFNSTWKNPTYAQAKIKVFAL